MELSEGSMEQLATHVRTQEQQFGTERTSSLLELVIIKDLLVPWDPAASMFFVGFIGSAQSL